MVALPQTRNHFAFTRKPLHLPATRLQRCLELDRLTRDLAGLVGTVDDPPRGGELGQVGRAARRQMPRQRVALPGSIGAEPALLHSLHHNLGGNVGGHGKIEVVVQAAAKLQLAIRSLVVSLPGELNIAAAVEKDNNAGSCAASPR